jgi:predicted HTH domain antitoxin
MALRRSGGVHVQATGGGRLTFSQTAELLDLGVYDVQPKVQERGIDLGATAEQYHQALETARQLRPQRKMSEKP